jgi:hypothetical protein
LSYLHVGHTKTFGINDLLTANYENGTSWRVSYVKLFLDGLMQGTEIGYIRGIGYIIRNSNCR